MFFAGKGATMRWSLDKVDKLNGDSKLIGVEIGVSEGENARDILQNMNIKMLYAVDVWDEYHDHGKRTTERFLSKVYEEFWNDVNIKIVKLDSVSASKMFKDNSVDFVYIDGNHSYKFVLKDIESWLPKIKEGGVLCGHDYKKDVLEAVTDLFGEVQHGTCQNGDEDWMIIKNIK